MHDKQKKVNYIKSLLLYDFSVSISIEFDRNYIGLINYY